MQKKLIALAIASAMTVPAMAYAEVNVSGQINMSLDMNKSGVPNADSSTNNLTSNQSRLVFKGSEDLGDGLSAIFALDNRFTADDGLANSTSTGSFYSGNTYLGLQSSSWGSVKAGIMDTPLKSSTRNLDVFFDVAGDYRAKVGSIGGLLTGHDLRVPNALAYSSPSMSGFTLAVATVFGAEGAVSTDTKGSGYSLAGMYNANGIYGSLAYETFKAGSTNSGSLGAGAAGQPFATAAVDDESTDIRLGLGYTMEAFTVNAMFEQPTYKTALTGLETKGTNFYLGGKWAFSASDDVRLAYTDRGETEIGSTKQNNAANQYAIGYSHNMSKATSVYVTYLATSADPSTAADPSSLSLGMKHAF